MISMSSLSDVEMFANDVDDTMVGVKISPLLGPRHERQDIEYGVKQLYLANSQQYSIFEFFTSKSVHSSLLGQSKLSQKRL